MRMVESRAHERAFDSSTSGNRRRAHGWTAGTSSAAEELQGAADEHDVLVAPKGATNALRMRRGGAMLEEIGQRVNERALDYYEPLRRIREHVEAHFGEDITLGQAARIAGREKKYVSALFHRKVGITFRVWLTMIRVREAVRLMEDRDWSITEIAGRVGFADLRTFERCFKRCTGTTPREVKKIVSP